MWLIPILLLGTFLRFYNNTAVALWHDEAFSALYIRYPFMEMMHRIALDVHPPLYYWILKLWTAILGDSLLSLRGLSIIFGVLTIWAGYLFIKQAFKNEKLALLTALFIAINPFQVQYALEARMYTLGTFLVLISSYFLLRALENNKKKYWIWYGLTAAACLYTHYFLVFSVTAQGLYALGAVLNLRQFSFSNFKTPKFLGLAGSYILALILFLPWLPTFLVQNQRVQQSYWIPKMDRWSVPGTVWKMVFGGEGINHLTLIMATLTAIGLVVYLLKKVKAREKWLVLLMLILPFLGSILISLKTAIYLDRYFVFASLFISTILAISFTQFAKFSARRALVSIFVIISLVVFFKNWKDLDVKNLFTQRLLNKKPGMAKAAKFINDRATDNDKIYVGSSFVFFTFKYYNHTKIKPLLYSTGSLSTIPHFSGTALLNDDDLILDFKPTPANKTVWLLWTTGFGGSKPNVPGNWSVVSEQEAQDTPGFKGKIVVTQYHVN